MRHFGIDDAIQMKPACLCNSDETHDYTWGGDALSFREKIRRDNPVGATGLASSMQPFIVFMDKDGKENSLEQQYNGKLLIRE